MEIVPRADGGLSPPNKSGEAAGGRKARLYVNTEDAKFLIFKDHDGQYYLSRP